MRIKRFTGVGVHGFLNLDIRFRNDLTFLIGINGSGKTTALNAIVALITPSLHVLAELEYHEIRVEIEHESKLLFISAIKDEELIRLTASGSDEDIVYKPYLPDRDTPPHRRLEYEQEYYREKAAENSDNFVMSLISSLPTPMFLGLDRRSRVSVPKIYRPVRTGRNVFSPSLSISLNDAAELAETSQRNNLIELGSLSERLQKSLLIELISFEPVSDFMSMSIPTRSDVSEIAQMRRNLETLPDILNLPADDVQDRMLSFLDALHEQAEKIPTRSSVRKLLHEREFFDANVANALIFWNSNRAQMKRIQIIADLLKDYNDKKKEYTRETDRFATLVNNFLKDSGKYISFDQRGYISLCNEILNKKSPISSLSSGEAQIFVILCHLFFNPVAQVGNVFIIDEPEISLHIQWQELFVSSVSSANSNIQYIFATHSPSIILDRDEHCVDMSFGG